MNGVMLDVTSDRLSDVCVAIAVCKPVLEQATCPDVVNVLGVWRMTFTVEHVFRARSACR